MDRDGHSLNVEVVSPELQLRRTPQPSDFVVFGGEMQRIDQLIGLLSVRMQWCCPGGRSNIAGTPFTLHEQTTATSVASVWVILEIIRASCHQALHV
jgi:hypothetical protein